MELLKLAGYVYCSTCISYSTIQLIVFGLEGIDKYRAKRKPVEVKSEIVKATDEKVYEIINKYDAESTKSRDEYIAKCEEFNMNAESFIEQCQDSRTGGAK